MRNILNVVAAISLVAGATGAVAQANYPDKAVRLVVPFIPGSPADVLARLVGQKFTEAWGKPFVIDSVPGAAGSVGAERVSRSAPDGYTLLFTGDAAMTTNVTLYGNLRYDPTRDFAPIMNFIETPNILVVHPSVPAKSVKELVALARARPGDLSYASGGSGTSQHLAGELLRSMARIDIVHVPYKGGPQALTDVLAGRVGMFFGNIFFTMPQMRAGKLHGLAVSSRKRVSTLPELPTVAESGYPGFEAVAWFGLLAPVGTPPAVLGKLQQESARVITLPDVRAKFIEAGAEIVGNSPAEFAAQIKAEIVRKGKLIRESGAKPN
jgi:tripartite-type tricarboxylate transporter receptor subunit TctC